MIINAPQKFDKFEQDKVFLAGSIEKGKAENWQVTVGNALDSDNVVILNPRRDDWDASWLETKEGKQFSEQVKWELDGQESANVILMYFDKDTQSPITLLELGLFGPSAHKMIVCCPDGFWRKGNVDIVCEHYNIKQVDTIAELIEAGREALVEEE
jgi:hypothetical protein